MFGHLDVTFSLEVLLLRVALAGLRAVNLDAQILWKAVLCGPSKCGFMAGAGNVLSYVYSGISLHL